MVAGGAGTAQAASYTVQKGDTLTSIAATHGTTIAALTHSNVLPRGPHRLQVGQVLSVPASPAPAAPAPAQAPAAMTYTVRAGDTVSHIALRSGVPAAAIISVNGLDARAFIRTGQVLNLPIAAPAPAAQAAPAPAAATYTVKPGDSVFVIAQHTGAQQAAILAANKLDRRGTIHPGQVLTLPGVVAPAPAPSTFAGRTYPPAVVQAAANNRAALAGREVLSRDQVRALVAETARRHGVDPALALAVSFQESGFNQRMVSPANAIGAMQVIPSTGRWASDMAGRSLDLLETRDNVLAGVLVLKALSAQADLPNAIAGYYQGLGSVRAQGMFSDTRVYVANVQTLMGRFTKG